MLPLLLMFQCLSVTAAGNRCPCESHSPSLGSHDSALRQLRPLSDTRQLEILDRIFFCDAMMVYEISWCSVPLWVGCYIWEGSRSSVPSPPLSLELCR